MQQTIDSYSHRFILTLQTICKKNAFFDDKMLVFGVVLLFVNMFFYHFSISFS